MEKKKHAKDLCARQQGYGSLLRRRRKKHIHISHAKEGISHKPAGQGRTKGWEVEDGQNVGHGRRTLSSLSFKTRAEQGGIHRMGAHHGPQARWRWLRGWNTQTRNLDLIMINRIQGTDHGQNYKHLIYLLQTSAIVHKGKELRVPQHQAAPHKARGFVTGKSKGAL
jgi:hypothetical protein